MSNGVNKVILIGHLGNNPEVKILTNGGQVANISIATSESWKDKSTGEDKEKTEWHRVVFFNRLAEIVGEYLKKGSKIYVEGKLQTRKWQAEDGSDRYSTEVVASSMQMLDRKNDNPLAQQAKAEGSSAGGSSSQQAASDDFDDDIPF